jgi:hypothetical protein
MTEVVNVRQLREAIDTLAQAVDQVARQAGDTLAVRRLQNDVDRLRLDAGDCDQLPAVHVERQLEIIPDTPYDESMWRDVDDEGLGGFHRPSSRR